MVFLYLTLNIIPWQQSFPKAAKNWCNENQPLSFRQQNLVIHGIISLQSLGVISIPKSHETEKQ